jgi:CDP-diacylglycerol--glycerol-3-phosphate 3-phosphatidyltransferase
MASSLARDIRTIPNLITLSRIVLLLVGGTLFFAGWRAVGVILAVIAGVTDYLDGAVARATGTVTRLGEVLDQFCDIFFESTVLMVAIYSGFFPAWVMPIYLFRELWVLCIRRYVAGLGVNIPSTLSGKAKTNFVMWGFLPTFLSVSGAFPWAEPYLAAVGYLSFGVGMGFSYFSLVVYTRAFVAAYNAGAGPTPGVRSGAGQNG